MSAGSVYYADLCFAGTLKKGKKAFKAITKKLWDYNKYGLRGFDDNFTLKSILS